MKFFTRGFKNHDVVKDKQAFETFEIKNGVGADDTILQDIFAPDPLTGNPSSDVFVESTRVNDALRDYIVNVLRKPINEGSRLSSADEALEFGRSIDETREEYVNRIIELTNKAD